MNKAIVGDWTDIDEYLKPFPQITHEQCDALATIAFDMRTRALMDVKQTYTKSGGTHLYVRKPDGSEYHVGRNGNVTKMESD